MKTLADFIRTGLIPCGQVLYVWGGGWNEEDTGGGDESRMIGLSPAWKKFYDENAAGYDYNDHRFENHNGLDCSGFVSWAVYNTLETESGHESYLTKSTLLAKSLSDRGFGEYVPNAEITLRGGYKPGDIISMNGHVWISLGTCEDGSVVILHSTTQGGVEISGSIIPGTGSVVKTADPETGKETISHEGGKPGLSMLAAARAMETYFPDWCRNFPVKLCGGSYFTGNLIHWTVLSDPDGIEAMKPEEIIRYVLGRRSFDKRPKSPDANSAGHCR